MRKITILILIITLSKIAQSQINPNLLKPIEKDTASLKLNMDAIYNRPFLNINKSPVSLGGYVEMNYQRIHTDGISDGHEFQFRRLSLFVASSISKKIKFLSEIEFENDKAEQLEGKPMEISIEYAAIDIEFHPLLNLRSGIVVNPIGSYNQNHDGPKWEFVEKPIAMHQMLPTTFSNMGFGLYGKQYKKHWMVGYEVYLTGGMDNSIIDNDKNKTYLPQSKENTSRLSTSNSGEPLVTAKLSGKNSKIGELGLSWMGGVYNKFQKDGVQIDAKRRCDVLDIDFNTTIPYLNTKLNAEWAWIWVQTPDSFNPQFGKKQHGGYLDLIQPIYKGEILGWKTASLQAGVRLEYVDWNVGTLATTGSPIAEDVWSITPTISFRPTPLTVLRLNYRYQSQRDFVGNSPSITNGVQFGLASYF